MYDATRRYSILTTIGVVVFFCCLLYSQESEWRGWRGLHLQGQSESKTPPTIWNDSLNVTWKSPLTGEGHSSPVISNDAVFISAAWPASSNPTWGLALKLFIFFLTISGSILLLRQFLRESIYDSNKFTDKWLLMLVGLFIHGIFFNHWLPEGFSASNTGMRFTFWFHSGILVGLALLIQAIHVSNKRTACTIIGAALIFWGIGLVGLRPNPEYYRLHSADIMVITRLYIPVVIMLICGAILFIFSVAQKQGLSLSPPESSRYQRTSLLTLSLAFILGICGFFAIPITNLLKSAALTIMSGRSLFSETFLNIELLSNLFSLQPHTHGSYSLSTSDSYYGFFR